MITLLKGSEDIPQLTSNFFRQHHSKLVAVLTHYFGLHRVEIAEDIVQDALIEAMEAWSSKGIPNNPTGWIYDVAKKKTINYLRRNHAFQQKILPKLTTENSFKETFNFSEQLIEDSTLNMIFVVCHPTLPVGAQIALALKSLCGLSIPEIAGALLTQEATINKRLFRARQKFRDGSIAFVVPPDEDLNKRLSSVFKTLYLLFNEGYYSNHNDLLIRVDLCYEAIRLLKIMVNAFLQSSEAKALLALMMLSFSRFKSRIDDSGAIVLLENQDRSSWDHDLITQGIDYLKASSGGNAISSYHLMAGISAEHCIASNFESTNWKSIHQQYQLLEKNNSGPIIQLNKAIARYYCGEQIEALNDLLALENKVDQPQQYLYWATLGKFYTSLNEPEHSRRCYKQALTKTESPKIRALIQENLIN